METLDREGAAATGSEGRPDGRPKARLAGIALVTLMVVATSMMGIFALRSREGAVGLAANPTGDRAPDFTLPLLEGGNLRLGSLGGSTLVVNFWASWCGPCKEEAPVLASASERWGDRGVRFIGVNVQDSKSAAKEFQTRYAIGYPSAYDVTGRTMRLYGVLGLPETFFIAPDGTVLAKWAGPITDSTIDRFLDAATGQAAARP